MRYKVPQNIDMEDKIVGSLTMVQFVYLMVGGMVIYVAWLLFTPTSFWIVAVPVALISLSMAFIKIQDQPFPVFIGNMLLYLVKPKGRFWQKDGSVEHLKIVNKKPSSPEEKSPTQQIVNKTELEQLSQVLDTGGKTAVIPSLEKDIPPINEQPSSDQLVPTDDEIGISITRKAPAPTKESVTTDSSEAAAQLDSQVTENKSDQGAENIQDSKLDQLRGAAGSVSATNLVEPETFDEMPGDYMNRAPTELTKESEFQHPPEPKTDTTNSNPLDPSWN